MFKLSRNRRASGFAQIPNAALRDTGLSARARGVLCYMLSHSDGFEVSRKMLGQQFPEGRDAIDTAVRELREAGYLRTERVQGEGGKFQGAQYLVYDERGAAEMDAENHEPGNPHAGARETGSLENRSPGKPQPYKNTIPIEDQHLEDQENTTRASVISDGFDRLWMVYPRRTGKRTAQQAFDRAVRRLSGKGHPADGLRPAVETILAGAVAFTQATVEAGTEQRFIPHPSTWLNGDRWADEPSAAPARQLTAAERMAQSLRSQAPQVANPALFGGEIGNELAR